ncbi:MAG: hypothetical protein ACP5UO_05590 [Thermoplasmata archaeon]
MRDLEEIVVFKGFTAHVSSGRIKSLTLGRPVRRTLRQYQTGFSSDDFSSLKREIEDGLREGRDLKLRFAHEIRYGAGHFVLIRDESFSGYAILTARDGKAPRGKYQLDVASGLGDTVNPYDTMMRETAEEFLYFLRESNSEAAKTHLVPVIRGRGKIIALKAAVKSRKCCFNETNSVAPLPAKSVPPSNSALLRLSDGSVLRCGVYLGSDSLEFIKALIIETGGHFSVNDIILHDGECSNGRCLDRKVVLVNLQNGECTAYQHGRIVFKGKFLGFLREYGFLERYREKGRIATIKVTETLRNWDYGWGNKEFLMPLIGDFR